MVTTVKISDDTNERLEELIETLPGETSKKGLVGESVERFKEELESE